MARTPIAARLQDAASVAGEAHVRGVETEQVLEERTERQRTRRELLRDAGVLGGEDRKSVV